jgi:DNA-binding response OmpR family regulator
MILHIDDEADVRAIVAQSLAAEGYRVASAAQLVDGIHSALQEKPQLILLDLHMPEGDGFETCKALRAVPGLDDIPIVFVSGMRDAKHRALAKELGAAGFLAKPFSVQELLAAVKRGLSAATPRRRS